MIRDILKEFKFTLIFTILLIVGYMLYKFAGKEIFVDVPNYVVEYCESKYSEEDFRWIEYNREKSGIHSRVSVVEDSSGNIFEVVRSYTDSGTIKYTDNYQGVKSLGKVEEIINSKIPKGSRYTIVVEDCIFDISEESSISNGTVIALNVEDDELWSRDCVGDFCESLPFRVNVKQVSNGKEQHFATTEDFEVIYR